MSEPKKWPSVLAYLAAGGTVWLFLSVLLLASSRINTGTATSVLLLSVLIVARNWGTGPAVLAAGCATAAYTYYFLPPPGLGVADPNDWVAFAAFTLTAVVAGGLWATAERQRHQIERLYRELRESFERATEAEAARRTERLKATLLDALTHNLRTPLTAIKAAVTALLNPGVSTAGAVAQEMIEVINEESDRLNRYISGLADHLPDAESTPASVRAVSVHEILQTVLTRAAVIVRDHPIRVDQAHDLPNAAVDVASITEAIYIVLDNATKYAPPGTTIHLTTESDDNRHVRIDVTDEGPGIPVELRERVFEKFYRIPGASSKRPGSGLGLSIARQLLETQGGRISIEASPRGQGTRVVVILPAAMEEPAGPMSLAR